jgi:membrane protease YdiL (CAAX protease family)
MLPERTWKADAILRLFLSVVVCFFAGWFTIAALQYAGGPAHPVTRFYVLLGASFLFLGITLVMLRRIWRLEDALLRLALVLACFYTGLTLGAWASRMAGPIKPSIVQMIISALSLQGAVLALITPFVREHQLTWAEAFGLKQKWPLAVLAGIAVGCVFLPVAWLLQELSARLMTQVHVHPEQQQVVQTLQMDHASAGRAIFGLMSILLVPPAEEIFFRGILYAWIRGAGYPRVALWGTALIFAAVHSNLVSFLPLAFFGMALALLYEWTGNLLAPITAHALFNAANLVRLYWLERALS